jgi:hypothetical protein
MKMVFKGYKIMQDYKEPKVKMYKLIWGLVFKCNAAKDNLIQFNSHRNIAIK